MTNFDHKISLIEKMDAEFMSNINMLFLSV